MWQVLVGEEAEEEVKALLADAGLRHSVVVEDVLALVEAETEGRRQRRRKKRAGKDEECDHLSACKRYNHMNLFY